MPVRDECITPTQNEATTEVVAVVENREVKILAGGALDLAQTGSLATQTAQVKQL